MNKRCVACSKFIKKVRGRKKIVLSTDEADAFSFYLGKNIAINNVLCGFCRVAAFKVVAEN